MAIQIRVKDLSTAHGTEKEKEGRAGSWCKPMRTTLRHLCEDKKSWGDKVIEILTDHFLFTSAPFLEAHTMM